MTGLEIGFKTCYRQLLGDLPFPTDKTAVIQKLKSLTATVGVDRFKAVAVDEFITLLDPAAVIPSVYRAYRPIVRDGLHFFLSRISVDRMTDILADQLLTAETCSREQRLFELAKKCPTLHKLGQLIARNRHIDANVRKWLIPLENGDYGTSIDQLLPLAEREVQSEKEIFSIRLGARVLSEASVGAVCPCVWQDPESGIVEKGVFKLLKPDVRALLTEELQILEALAAFFQERTHHYPLDDFKYIEVFRDIGKALAEEIDLLGEQAHLWDAYLFYDDRRHIRIPKLAPFSTRNLTVMSRLEGEKITDAAITDEEKKACASRLFSTLIFKPLFSTSEETIFHGDPHAGNILAHKAEKDHPVAISIVDWSLAGHLKKSLRINLIQLFQYVVLGNKEFIGRTIMTLCSPKRPEGEISYRQLDDALTSAMSSKTYTDAVLMKKMFFLIDCASRCGMVFRPELLLFRKAFFTLEGVLCDLNPAFDIDAVTADCLRTLFFQEMPKRLGALLLPVTDAPEKYASLISNKDLQRLASHYALAGLKHGTVKILALRHFMNALGPPFSFSTAPEFSCEPAV